MLSRRPQKKVLEVGPCSCLALPTDYGGVMQVVLVHSLGRQAAAAAAEIDKHLPEATSRPW